MNWGGGVPPLQNQVPHSLKPYSNTYSLPFAFFSLAHTRSRSKVLTRWLAGLPQQLVLLGLRNAELSDQLIGTIYSAASRENKEILQSLQAAAPRIYGTSFAELLKLAIGNKDSWFLRNPR